jgi:hypothetical protein
MADSPRRMLRKAIESRLLPALTALGFAAVPLAGEDATSREIRASFPFGRHRRVGPDGRFEMVEVQLDKHSDAFRLNLGSAPAGGIVRPRGPVPQEEVWVHYLPVSYALYRWPRFRKWFSLWLVPRQSKDQIPTQADYDALASRVAELLPEVDLLFSQGKRGPHIRKIDMGPD